MLRWFDKQSKLLRITLFVLVEFLVVAVPVYWLVIPYREMLSLDHDKLKRIDQGINWVDQYGNGDNLVYIGQSKLTDGEAFFLFMRAVMLDVPGLVILSADVKASGELGVDKKGSKLNSSYLSALYGKGLIKNTVEVKMQGDYFGMMTYLNQLAKENIGLYWESIDMRVVTYPKIKATMRVFSLSKSRWL